MSHRRTFTFLLLQGLLFLIALPTPAQRAMFNHLTVDDGLKTNNITAIAQDYQGFIWFGTEDGLHRYDGYTLKAYSNDPDDSSSIKGNLAITIYEDSFRRLWIGTLDGGLALYNRDRDSFYNFMPNEEDSTSLCGIKIGALYETADQILWIASDQGCLSYVDLKTFDSERPVFHTIQLPENIKSAGQWMRSIDDAGEGRLWITVNGAGLILFNPATDEFAPVFNSTNYNGVFIDLRTSVMMKDNQGRIWFGSFGGGLYVYFPEEQRLLNYAKKNDKDCLPNNQIVSLALDKSGNFWVGSDNGLARMTDFNDRYPEGRFEVYNHDPFDNYSLSSNEVKRIFVDRSKKLWVATYFGGVNMYDPDNFRFRTIRNHPLIKGSLPGKNVSAITIDGVENLWIGSDGEGLAKLKNGLSRLDSNAFEKVPLINSKTGKEEKKIKSIIISKDKRLWIGTWGGGMFLHDPEKKTTRHFPYDKGGGLPSESILGLAEDQEGNIWIGTFNAGLALYHPESERYTYYRHIPGDSNSIAGNKISALLVDHEDNVWIGIEGGGLQRYDREKDIFHHIQNNAISYTANVTSLFECSDNNLWVGIHTAGLIWLNKKTQEVRVYNTKNGLAGNLIQAIIEDKQHHLWVSTNNGLSKLSVKDKTFTNYSQEEGLQSRQFNPNSAFVCEDGTVLFGGVNGMNAFDPLQIKKSDYDLEVVFTNFWIGNTEYSLNSKESLINKNIVVSDTIELGYDQNSFSIEFSALEYDFAHRTSYSYMLEGFDKEWQPVTTQRRLTYTNLNPGEYTLLVRPINKDGFRSSIVSSLRIHVKPALYQTKTFWGGMILLVFSLSALIVQMRINFFKRQNRVLEIKVKQRTEDLQIKNSEVLERNEELETKNYQIMEQQEELEAARVKLEEVNANLETLVDERTEKLEKTIAELDRFVYSASHDLSAPLKSILGLLNIAKLDRDTQRTVEYLAYIEDSIVKLEDVIKNLISYSRNSRLALEMEAVFLHELVEEVFDELQFLEGAKRIATSVNIPGGFQIISDKKRLKIIFHNLLNNAIKYADLNKPSPMIVVSLIDDGTHWIIEIHDNGIGIGKEFHDKVFGMFYRATERSKGSGLGLYIVHESISVLGGRIFLDSELGKETTFTIYLPK